MQPSEHVQLVPMFLLGRVEREEDRGNRADQKRVDKHSNEHPGDGDDSAFRVGSPFGGGLGRQVSVAHSDHGLDGPVETHQVQLNDTAVVVTQTELPVVRVIDVVDWR
jgi:hypothetical protein